MADQYSNMKSKSTNVRYGRTKQWTRRMLLETFRKAAPRQTKRFIQQQFFAPLPYKSSATENHWLRQGQPFRFQVHDKTLQGWKWGRGPGILFVHGWNGRGIQFQPFFKPILNAGYSVTVFDAPAHGDSQGRFTHYFDFTDAVRTLLRQRSGTCFSGVVAHSLGGSAVINCLSKESIELRAVLIAPALKLKELLFNTFNLHGIPESLYLEMIEALETRFGYDLTQDNPHLLLGRLHQEILIIHDRDDRAIPYPDAQAASERFSNVTLYSTSMLGHRRILQDSHVVNDTIHYLLDRGVPRSSARSA